MYPSTLHCLGWVTGHSGGVGEESVATRYTLVAYGGPTVCEALWGRLPRASGTAGLRQSTVWQHVCHRHTVPQHKIRVLPPSPTLTPTLNLSAQATVPQHKVYLLPQTPAQRRAAPPRLIRLGLRVGTGSGFGLVAEWRAPPRLFDCSRRCPIVV